MPPQLDTVRPLSSVLPTVVGAVMNDCGAVLISAWLLCDDNASGRFPLPGIAKPPEGSLLLLCSNSGPCMVLSDGCNEDCAEGPATAVAACGCAGETGADDPASSSSLTLSSLCCH
ncbi:proteophosphoglycan ppg4 [Moniliophthora roreri]|nr:proteophosphoglycan ppg4 [Moniliophthora roreri]